MKKYFTMSSATILNAALSVLMPGTSYMYEMSHYGTPVLLF